MKMSRLMSAHLVAIVVAVSCNAYAESIETSKMYTMTKPEATVKDGSHSNDSIIKEIRSQIKEDDELASLKINVSVKNGVVMFSGDVNSDNDIDSLVEIAQSVNGVHDVDIEHLNIHTNKQYSADRVTTAKVKGLLSKNNVFGDDDLDDLEIEVATKNGVVTITGPITNERQIKNAIKIAGDVKGVKKVEYKQSVADDEDDDGDDA